MDCFLRAAIFIGLLLISLSLALSVSAICTDFWLEAGPLERNGSLSVASHLHSGLFSGVRRIDWPLRLRETPFSVLDEVQHDAGFVTKSRWLFLVFLLSLGLLLTGVGVLVGVLNSVIRAEIYNDVTGPIGICLWCILAVFCNATAALFFAGHYLHALVPDGGALLLDEHTRLGFSTKNHLRLGFSFWLLVGSVAVQVLPILLTLLALKCGTSSTLERRPQSAFPLDPTLGPNGFGRSVKVGNRKIYAQDSTILMY